MRFACGDRVDHLYFGPGVVKKVDYGKESYTIEFTGLSGEKEGREIADWAKSLKEKNHAWTQDEINAKQEHLSGRKKKAFVFENASWAWIDKYHYTHKINNI